MIALVVFTASFIVPITSRGAMKKAEEAIATVYIAIGARVYVSRR